MKQRTVQRTQQLHSDSLAAEVDGTHLVVKERRLRRDHFGTLFHFPC